MKFLTTIHNINNIKELIHEADGLVIGVEGFSTRETAYFNFDEIKEISKILTKNNKELYLSFKPFLHNEDKKLKDFFNKIDFEVSGIIIGDIGYYYLLKDFNIPIIYNPETLITNTFDLNIHFKEGLKGLFLSKELHLDDLKEMILGKEGNLYLVGHGHLNMFYSRRNLLTSYFKEIDKPFIYKNKKLTIKEEKRSEYMPIIEDDFGTHVYRSKVSSVVGYLEQLKGLDYLLIDSMFYDDYYAVDILKMFKNKITKEEVTNKYDQSWDNAFLTTKTIYKRDLNDWIISSSRRFRKT